MSKSGKTEILPASYALKRKVVGGRLDTKLDIDPELLARAEAVVETLGVEYISWLEQDLKALRAAFDQAEKDAQNRPEHITRIAGIAHDMAGQAGTFGYPLITQIGRSLYDFATAIEAFEPVHLEIVKAHIDAMNVVRTDDLKSDGAPKGPELMAELRRAVEKYL